MGFIELIILDPTHIYQNRSAWGYSHDLAWRDISLVFLGAEAGEAELTRHAAGLRKRFERIKARLRALVAGAEADGAEP